MSVQLKLQPFEAQIWRILPQTRAHDPFAPARAPEGRFHHSGQIAAYASLSAEGAHIAIQRYLSDGAPRIILSMQYKAARVADVSHDPAASLVWQDERAKGLRASTWRFSDAARAAGAQAMLYASRSRPNLRHIVLFDTSCLSRPGPAQPLPPRLL